MADIARLAGVSKATVSRALNDSPLVSRETRERVQVLARAHDFEINATARRLSTRQSNVIALRMCPNERLDPSEAASPTPAGSPPGPRLAAGFLLELISGLTAQLHTKGYDLLLVQGSVADTGWISRYLDSGRADGFVLLQGSYTSEQLRLLEERGAAFVVWGLDSSSRSFSTVTGDSFAGGRLATRHLLARGRKRIAFLGGPELEQEARDRYRGYSAALAAAGLQADDALITHGFYSAEAGSARLRTLLARRPDLDAVFACSDTMAIAAIDILQASGRRVPDDVAVVGYDDIALAAHTDPPLTTVRQPGPLAGRLLADSLIQRLQTRAVSHISIPAELVVRGSA